MELAGPPTPSPSTSQTHRLPCPFLFSRPGLSEVSGGVPSLGLCTSCVSCLRYQPGSALTSPRSLLTRALPLGVVPTCVPGSHSGAWHRADAQHRSAKVARMTLLNTRTAACRWFPRPPCKRFCVGTDQPACAAAL